MRFIMLHCFLEGLVIAWNKRGWLKRIMDNLKLTSSTLEQLKLFQERIAAKGKGVRALFTGPRETGNTIAASSVSRNTGLDLHRIDLSLLVSKYIGETEKNLNRVFDEADESSTILIFDEADALFGKRTDVNDAHDRYANLETSYLLERLEQYEGIVILSSNSKDQIDEVFLRLIDAVVEIKTYAEPLSLCQRVRYWFAALFR